MPWKTSAGIEFLEGPHPLVRPQGHVRCANAGVLGLPYTSFGRRDSTTNEVIDGDDFFVVGTVRSFQTLQYRAILLRAAAGSERP